MNKTEDQNNRPSTSSSRPERTPNDRDWGFATKADGTIVIRNWYFALVAAGFIGLSLLMLVNVPPVGILMLALSGWALRLESKGVEIYEGSISYPVRLGLPFALATELPPLFTRTLELSQVSNATTENIQNRTSWFLQDRLRVALLTGEFGAAKIVFDSKAGRDRLFAILKDKYPHIKIYRWT